MTKLHRPCTLWGQTFDAIKVVSLNEERKESLEHHVRVCISKPHPANRYDSFCVVFSPHFMPPLEAFRIANYTIYQALNAPVKATHAVLDAMEKVPEARFSIVEKCIAYNRDVKHPIEKDKEGWSYWDSGTFTYLQINDYIQADCPLALQVLLQFTLDGVRIKEKETD